LFLTARISIEAAIGRPDTFQEDLMSHVHVHRVESPNERTLPAFEEADRVLERVQQRAFELCAARGFSPGRALDDWLSAERELCRPAAEVLEGDNGYVVSVALPGFEAGEVELTVTPRDLIIRAKSSRERTHPNVGTGSKAASSTFQTNSVFRCINLPAAIRVKDVKATVEHGLLTIVTPKS
jgi:HSP20 family molecular chaperone IbpA